MTFPDQSWVISNIKSKSNIEIVAFLQNNITKEIYQAVSDTINNIVVGVERIPGRNSIDFGLYPNPAVKQLTVTFAEPLQANSEIRIYDLRGTVFSTWKAESGLSEYTIEDLGLTRGIYLVRISRKGIDLGFRKLIVSGD